jgi:4-hydroxyacetophenone monooxygenase
MSSPFQEQVQRAVRDEAALRSALAEADIAPMLMVLVQLTGDLAILEEVAPHIHGAWSFLESVPEPLKQKVRDRLVEALQDYAVDDRPPPPLPPSATLQRMMSGGVGQTVPEEYIPVLVEETRLAEEDPRAVRWRRDPARLPLGEMQVVIIGAGFAGLGMAVRLKQMGIPFTILEKNPTVGGTWLENQYPGCAVDTPNHFFSYSFAPNNAWSRHFSQRPEIHRYIEECYDRYDIRRHVRFGVEVTRAAYDEAQARWQVSARPVAGGAEEALSCRVLISAVGQLNRPAIPAIPGLDDFAGPLFHTARWDASVPLAGKRVAMIGTGASAMQAAPSIAPEVARLVVFQRTPHWAVHNPNYHKTVSAGNLWCLQNIPYFGQWLRFQLFWAGSDGFHASLQVDPGWTQPDLSLNEANHRMREMLIEHVRKELDGDEELLAKVIPGYPPYGKRMLRDNHWYRMLKRPNVTLETGQIERITPGSIVMRDGTEHMVDVIILATGFQASKMLTPMEIAGRGGRTLRDAWGDDDPRAYLGMTAPGFPNFFMIYGPNTNLAHGGSILFHHECQVRYICQALREMVEQGYASLEVRPEVHDAYNHLVDETCRRMVWSHPGVTSWYKNKNNRVTVTSPWRLLDYWKLTQHFVPEEFRAARPGEAMQVPGQGRAAVGSAERLTVS